MPIRVLIVDSDANARRAIADSIAAEKFEIIEASSASDVLSALKGGGFEVALLDADQTEGNGLRLLWALKAQCPSVQAILVSRTASVHKVVEGIRAGAFDFLEKPIEQTTLRKVIDLALVRRRRSEMTALVRASQVIFATKGPSELPQAIVDVATEVMEADTGSLFLTGIDGLLFISHARGIPLDVQKSTRVTVGVGVVGNVAASRTPLILSGEIQRAPQPDDQRRQSIRSSIIYPLVSSDRLLGVLTFNRISGDQDFQAGDLNLASVLASQIVLAIDNSRLVRESATSERLAAVGQLAAGVAHEINTPVQFIGDNITFLHRSFELLAGVSSAATAVLKALADRPEVCPEVTELARTVKKARLDFILPQMPRALAQAREGVQRIASIVGAMKEFSHPSMDEKELVDLAHLITMTVAVACGEWKYVATVETCLDPQMPPIPVLRNRFNQVILNLVVNAAHAIGERTGNGSEGMGIIRISTRMEADCAVIEVSDTGAGIPEAIVGRIFEPFFTTKPVGKGTGQGLAIAYNVVVEQHGGHIGVKSECGKGTTFLIRLPTTVASSRDALQLAVG